MTHFLAVRDVGRARASYADVLGGRVVTEESPCIVRLAQGLGDYEPGRRAPRPRGGMLSACPTRHRAGSRAS
jgi:hypothetical protein